MLQDKFMLRRLDRMARAKSYSIRDVQILLEIEGYRRPSLDFIWKYFRKVRRGKIKRIV